MRNPLRQRWPLKFGQRCKVEAHDNGRTTKMHKGKRKRYAAEFKAKVAPRELRSVGSAFERRYALAAGEQTPCRSPKVV